MIHKTNDSLIIIQAEATALNKTGVVFWSYDRGTAKLRFKLMKDSQAQSLPEGTTVPIRLIFKSSTAKDGYGKHDYLATIEDRLRGIVSIVLADNILGYIGTVEGSIYIDFPNDQSLDTAGRFSFAIKRSPIDDTTPELEDYYFNGFKQFNDKIIEIQTKIDKFEKQTDEVISNVEKTANEAIDNVNNTATNATERIEEVATNATNEIKTTADDVVKKLEDSDVYTAPEADAKFVNMSDSQDVFGIKNFFDGAQSKGFPVAIDRTATKTVTTTNTDEFSEASNVIFERTGRFVVAYMMIENKNANFAGWKTLAQFPDGFRPKYYNNWGGALSNRKTRNLALTLYANANGIQVMAPTTNFPAGQECVGSVTYSTNDDWPAIETLDTPEQIEDNCKLPQI